MDKDLILDDGTTLKFLKKDPKFFLNQTTLLFGQTASGKSCLIDEIMYLCKDYIPNIFVICLSVVTISSSAYYNKIPTNCIKSTVNKEWLEDLMRIQKGRAAIYKTANDPSTLKLVFDKVKSSNEIALENDILNKSASFINTINTSAKLDFAQKKEKTTEVEDIRDRHLKELYKTYIRKHKISLENKSNLSKEEICCVKNIDFNPNLMLILDDCASSFKKWVKESTIIKEMFYMGRHSFITLIISSQDDKEIDPELRKNAIITIFTTSQAANTNFDRASNSYSKYIKKRSEACTNRVFNNQNTKNFKKLIYHSKSFQDHFYYTIADLYPPFKMGCNSIWELDKGISELNKDSNDDENQFFSQYYNK
jgi:hypothetical protein